MCAHVDMCVFHPPIFTWLLEVYEISCLDMAVEYITFLCFWFPATYISRILIYRSGGSSHSGSSLGSSRSPFSKLGAPNTSKVNMQHNNKIDVQLCFSICEYNADDFVASICVALGQVWLL